MHLYIDLNIIIQLKAIHCKHKMENNQRPLKMYISSNKQHLKYIQ